MKQDTSNGDDTLQEQRQMGPTHVNKVQSLHMLTESIVQRCKESQVMSRGRANWQQTITMSPAQLKVVGAILTGKGAFSCWVRGVVCANIYIYIYYRQSVWRLDAQCHRERLRVCVVCRGCVLCFLVRDTRSHRACAHTTHSLTDWAGESSFVWVRSFLIFELRCSFPRFACL